ncbi:DUF5107 domain-containing protein [Saccharothrix sp. NPDC042600]|uniref:DUF5107 domain-containing protein n=1 Tax=Saccharothrix TaxID=2071 RepID=UPI0033CFB63B|nr:DUF5107 domain-containing protein [Saccharothrix mutabilis subsp. capreolus]
MTPRREALTLRMSGVGPTNPLPPLAGLLDPPYRLDFSDVPPHIAAGAAYGGVRTVFPYLLQDGYGRAPRPSTVDAVVLENSRVRATFLPGLGGRLWSLVADGRELLFQPRVLQPANLGLRGAWFAGGVEWNIGTRGHCPFTCDPLHTAVVTRPDGTRVLRMWEYERMRGVVFQVDAWLPPDSPVLVVGVRIRNPRAETVPMYWWSNAAVPQTPDTVVRAPADTAFLASYTGRVERVPARDLAPGREAKAVDYFYEVPDEVGQPWVEAVGGLVQASTGRLRGRKLFCWGETVGGRHWQEWLGGGAYCEIQAGLATTQYEHLPLPGGAQWTWVESYGPVRPGDLGGALAAFEETADLPVGEVLLSGSGWGALEDRVSPGISTPATPFTATGPEQAPWVALLDAGFLPVGDPVSYVVGEHWRKLLESSPQNWATAYHLGVMAHAEGDVEAARAHYLASLAHRDTSWALRALGVLDGSADLLVAAHAADPSRWQLAVEAVSALLSSGRAAQALAFVDAVPESVRSHGRIRLAEVRAALAAGSRERAAAVLRAGFDVDDLREGEVSLDALWRQACPDETLPARYDFRMKPA